MKKEIKDKCKIISLESEIAKQKIIIESLIYRIKDLNTILDMLK